MYFSSNDYATIKRQLTEDQPDHVSFSRSTLHVNKFWLFLYQTLPIVNCRQLNQGDLAAHDPLTEFEEEHGAE